jgi:hypothetical protein
MGQNHVKSPLLKIMYLVLLQLFGLSTVPRIISLPGRVYLPIPVIPENKS